MEQTFKPRKGLAYNGISYYKGNYDKPMVCPYCSTIGEASTDGMRELPIARNDTALVVSMHCPACDERYLAIYQTDAGKTKAEFLQIVPVLKNNIQHFPNLYKVSVQFEIYHGQSMKAWISGDKALAIAGFRSAIDFLLKDFAIYEDNVDRNTVEKETFQASIARYFDALGKSADVVRALGNDYVHYRKKHPDVPEDSVLAYYNIVLSQMNALYLMKHTPLDTK